MCGGRCGQESRFFLFILHRVHLFLIHLPQKAIMEGKTCVLGVVSVRLGNQKTWICSDWDSSKVDANDLNGSSNVQEAQKLGHSPLWSENSGKYFLWQYVCVGIWEIDPAAYVDGILKVSCPDQRESISE